MKVIEIMRVLSTMPPQANVVMPDGLDVVRVAHRPDGNVVITDMGSTDEVPDTVIMAIPYETAGYVADLVQEELTKAIRCDSDTIDTVAKHMFRIDKQLERNDPEVYYE